MRQKGNNLLFKLVNASLVVQFLVLGLDEIGSLGILLVN